jgi:hypothetical protein
MPEETCFYNTAHHAANKAYAQAKCLYGSMEDVRVFLFLEWRRVVESYEAWIETASLLQHALQHMEYTHCPEEDTLVLQDMLLTHIQYTCHNTFFECCIHALQKAAAHARACVQTSRGGSEPGS